MSNVAVTAAEAPFVPGISQHCDQWCSYCPMTARCLAYRRFVARQEQQGPDAFRDFDDVIAFTREIAAMEGRTTPELDALLSPDPTVRDSVPEVDDPLDDLAARYAFDVARFLGRRGWTPPIRPTPQPSPLDVVAWYHEMMHLRLSRALASAILAERGRRENIVDANGCAKVVLVGIDRSRAALRRLRGQRDDTRGVALLETLDALSAAVERRFPFARDFIRPGLDAPVA